MERIAVDVLVDFFARFITQFQSPALAFLIGGMLIGATGSRLKIPNSIYQFIVFMLLMRIGLSGGMEIREANILDMLLPAFMAAITGLTVVWAGSGLLSMLPNIRKEDSIATAGLFGAVSASTLAAALLLLEEESITFEAWAPALYPFMDIPALILAIVLANIHHIKQHEGEEAKIDIPGMIKDSLRGSALSALLLGMALGYFADITKIFDTFYNPLFKGFLSILMLVMGMEAYERLHELRRVAQWYAIYGLIAPILHGLLAFGLGYIAHILVGFSPGGIIVMSILAASSSDVSGPPTLRAGIPTANPSTYIGASTSVGTPVAIAICIPLFISLSKAVFS